MAALFVDEYDFIYTPYKVPNQSESTSFQTYLAVKEEDILKALMGWEFWAEFWAAITGVAPAQKYIDIRDGAEYTYGGETFKYEGLNDFLVPAIWAHWQRDNAFKVTNIGVGINTKTDFTNLNPGNVISRAYNEYSYKVGNEECYRNTFWGFMQANYATYTAWEAFEDFNDPGTLNSFGI